MTKHLLPSLLLTFALPLCVLSQTLHDGLEFSRTEFEFKNAENWVSRVDSIEVKNVTAKKIHLLKLNDPQGFELRYPNRAIEPGTTEVIEVIYKPKETGKFSHSFTIYHSASQKPITIHYKGDIKSFDEFATAACPSFQKASLRPVDFLMEVSVVDSATKKPLSNSMVEIGQGEFFSQHRTDAGGMHRQRTGINYYILLAEHPGYQSRWKGKHFNPKNNKITIELPAISVTTPATPSVIITPEKPPVPAVPPVIVKIDSSSSKPVSTTPSFPLSAYKKNNIVFLIDKSSSMNKPDCMPFLQTAMTELAGMLRSEDRITIITYANESKVVLPGTAGNENEKITTVIRELHCGGRTEGGKAIHAAYENAEANFIPGGINQIIIATDGGFNGLSENESEMEKLAKKKAQDGITLSVISFGQNRFGKAHIERLARYGSGTYNFIATEAEAKTRLKETIKERSLIK